MGKENTGNAVNLLCEGTMIVGDIKTKNDIRIDGILKGKVITSGRLVVGSTAKIEGNIDCANVDVMGVVLGDVQASGIVSLKAQAKLIGNIISNQLSIEPGVIFNGNCQMQRKDSRDSKEANKE
ncbi:MAG: polymer-forming cytoskeletal protein [Odoribacter splanchnicus]|nr:polymer-forming cytoskeletal protein [Odoribacter splanchnicus]